MYINSNSILEQTIHLLISQNFPPSTILSKCFIHLSTILSNLIEKPYEEKYRIIKKKNEKISNELLIFPEAEQFLLLIGFEEILLEDELCLIYNGGEENLGNLEQALKIVRNKLRNDIEVYLNNHKEENYDKDPVRQAVHKEVVNRKKELEEMKEIKENIIKDFEANKKYNIEIRKSLDNPSIPKTQNQEIFKKPLAKTSFVGSETDNNPSFSNNPKYIPKSKPSNQNNPSSIGGKKEFKGRNKTNKKPKKKVVGLQDYGRLD